MPNIMYELAYVNAATGQKKHAILLESDGSVYVEWERLEELVKGSSFLYMGDIYNNEYVERHNTGLALVKILLKVREELRAEAKTDSSLFP